jgi:hypothetical protein
MKRMKSANGLSIFRNVKHKGHLGHMRPGALQKRRLRAITAREQEPVLREELRPAAAPAAGLRPAAVLRLLVVLQQVRSDYRQPGTSPLRGLQALLVMSFF